MKLLPRRTHPSLTRVDRRHRPPKARHRYGYRAYRACLRWDFGFTCAFCLLHEADLAEHGAEGLGLLGTEHFSPVSAGVEGINEYCNCFYCCRFCNEARAAAPVVRCQGGRLINPCLSPWGRRFQLTDDDRLQPAADDPDALYTAGIYDLNDPRKVALRSARRARLDESRELLGEGPDLVAAALLACERAATPEEAVSLLSIAERLRREMLRARKGLERYAAIPRDADASCRCGRVHLALPGWLEEQTWELAV